LEIVVCTSARYEESNPGCLSKLIVLGETEHRTLGRRLGDKQRYQDSLST